MRTGRARAVTGAGGVIGERGPGWGVDWGTPGEIPSGALVARSDSEAAGIVAEARRAGRWDSSGVVDGR